MVTKKVSTTEVSENKNVRIYSVSHMVYHNTSDVKITFDSDGDLSFSEEGADEDDPFMVIDKNDIKAFIDVLTKYVKEHNPND